MIYKLIARILTVVGFLQIFIAADLFDGSDDYINCGNTPDTDYNNFTISVWYKSTNTSASDDSYIWAHSNTSPTFGRTDDSGEGGNCRFHFTVAGGDSDIYSTTGIEDQTWHLLTIVRSSGNYRKLYIDGIEEATTTDDGSSVSHTNTLYIGDYPNNTEQVDGQLTELIMWQAVLTPAEILSIYTARKKRFVLQIQPSAIDYYFPFDDHPDGTSTDGLNVAELIQSQNGTWVGGTAKSESYLNF